MDLPEQIGLMRANPDLRGSSTASGRSLIDWLRRALRLTARAKRTSSDEPVPRLLQPRGSGGILNEAKKALAENGVIVVMEPLCDRQRNDTAALSLAASSLYFTVLANGNSRFFFEADLLEIFEAAGLEVIESHRNLGVRHTLFVLRPKV